MEQLIDAYRKDNHRPKRSLKDSGPQQRMLERRLPQITGATSEGFNAKNQLGASNDGSVAENLTMTDINNATYMTGAGSMFDPQYDKKLYGPLTS